MKHILWLVLFVACSTSTHWKVDSIATGNKSFESSRLSHQSHTSPLCLEFIRCGQEISCFLSLNQFRFRPQPTDPPTVKAQLTIEGNTFEESYPLAQGQMRLYLPTSTAELLLSSLQKGKDVRIEIDGFEEAFLSENFQTVYEKWKGGSSLLKTLFLGLE